MNPNCLLCLWARGILLGIIYILWLSNIRIVHGKKASTLQTQYVAANVLRVGWENNDVTTENDVITGYDVWGGPKNCSRNIRSLDNKTQEVDVWDVDSVTDYHVCVCFKMADSEYRWLNKSVEPIRRIEPPVILAIQPPEVHEPAFQNANLEYCSPGDMCRIELFYEDYDIKANYRIKCVATGFPKPDIAWYKDERPTSGDRYIVHQDGTLEIVGLVKEDMGRYYCTATNIHGSTRSNVLELKATGWRQDGIYHDRMHSLVVKQESLVLECSTELSYSYPPPSYLWLKDDDMLTEDENVLVTDTGSLVFKSLRASDIRRYQCEVQNSLLGLSLRGTIYDLEDEGRTIVPNLKLLHHSQVPEVPLAGHPVKLVCLVGGSLNREVEWRRGGDILISDNKYNINTSESKLVIYNTTTDDSGLYSCHIGGETMKRFQIIVKASPKLTTRPASHNATDNDDVTFTCDAVGEPSPNIEWRMDREDKSHITKYSMSDGGRKLTLHRVNQRQEIMSIQCNVSNAYGYEYENIYLNVFDPLIWIRRPTNQIIQTTEVRIIPCQVIAHPLTYLDITWFDEYGVEISSDPKQTVYVREDRALVINGSKPAINDTEFTCSVLNNNVRVNQSCNIQMSNDYLALMVGHSSSSNFFKDYKYHLLIVGAVVLVLVIVIAMSIVGYRRIKYVAQVKSDQACLQHRSVSSYGSKSTITSDLTDKRNYSGSDYMCDSVFDISGTLDSRLREVFIPRDQIELGELVGKGQFGRVYCGYLKNCYNKVLSQVAVKTLKYKSTETDMVGLFLQEALLMNNFKHDNVLSLIGICFDVDSSPMAVLPFMANGDLRQYIQDPNKDITVLQLLEFGLYVAEGMDYLAKSGFVHRDLAARNCMVDNNTLVKVADFGLSRDLHSRDYYRIEDGKSPPLPVRWMAPECLTDSVYTHNSDMWSYGVLLWELMTRGSVPYNDVENWDVSIYVQSGKRLLQPEYCPDSVYSIMQTAWSPLAERRPRFEQVVRTIHRIINCATNPVNNSRQHNRMRNRMDYPRNRTCSLRSQRSINTRKQSSLQRPSAMRSTDTGIHRDYNRHSLPEVHSLPDLLSLNCDWTAPYSNHSASRKPAQIPQVFAPSRRRCASQNNHPDYRSGLDKSVFCHS